jgi:23S rRNA (cytidine1920-2'-O)/16S rRNA (cytidine1409-2'-O)-methyltransferase
VGRYVSRGGDKLEFALERFEVAVTARTAADLGSHVGGFVDCLLEHGVARVYSVDTCYGTLAWRLRQDERVVVMERTNAMHVNLPEPVDLVTVDVGWTKQERVLPRAVGLARPGGLVVSLLKPQYEAERAEVRGGVLDPLAARDVAARVVRGLAEQGIRVAEYTESPITGAKGNHEFWLKIRVASSEAV